MKHVKKISCKTCIKYHICAAYMPDEECYQGKKTTSMEEKIRRREAIAAWRKSVNKMYNN